MARQNDRFGPALGTPAEVLVPPLHLLHINPPHEELAALLAPHGVEVAYDGLTVDL